MTAKSRQRKALKKAHSKTQSHVAIVPVLDQATESTQYLREPCTCDKGQNHFKEKN